MPTLTIERPIHFGRQSNGQVVLRETAPIVPPRVPRVTQWLALAHRFDAELRDGLASSQGALAKQYGVTGARMYQILNLLNLAPDIQEAILSLPPTRGRDTILLEDLQPIASTLAWSEQRRMWKLVCEGLN